MKEKYESKYESVIEKPHHRAPSSRAQYRTYPIDICTREQRLLTTNVFVQISMYVCETKFYRRQGCSGGDSTAALPNVSYVHVPVPATGASHVLFKTR